MTSNEVKLIACDLVVGERQEPQNEALTKPPKRSEEAQPLPKAQRGTIEQAMDILGLPVRTVQDMAARGELPGAAKFGRRWTFDLHRLQRHVRDKERQTWRNAKLRPDATGAAVPSGAALRSTAT